MLLTIRNKFSTSFFQNRTPFSDVDDGKNVNYLLNKQKCGIHLTIYQDHCSPRQEVEIQCSKSVILNRKSASSFS